MLDKIKEIKDYIEQSKYGKNILHTKLSRDELSVEIDATDVPAFLEFIKHDNKLLFKQLISICGVDWPEKEKRFEIVYCMLSLEHNARLIVKTRVAENEPVPSVHEVFRCATWYEREVWDMYGVPFSNNPDLRRILTDYGFAGHPLRKDFPLTGHVEVRYDTEQKRVVYQPVTLTQEFRNFDYLSPWSGNEALPGDEKATKGQ